MINIKSFAKKTNSNNSNSGGGFATTIINNNTTTNTELDLHTLWGQPFNGTQDVSGDLSNVGNISANGDIITNGDISAGDINSNSVTTNLVDSNTITADNGTIDILTSITGTFDNLTVENLTATAAHFFQLSIDEIKSVGGQMIITPANAKIDWVDINGNYYSCYFRTTDGDKEIDNEFAVNDQVVCSSFNIADNGNKFYWAKVIEVDTTPITAGDGIEYHYIILDMGDKSSNSNGVPTAGDKIVQLGNRTATDRQAAIIISAYNNQFLDAGINAPSIVQYSGINNYNLSSHRLNVLSKGLNSFKGNFTTEAGDTLDDAVSNISQLEQTTDSITTQVAQIYDNPNIFSMATYNGILSNNNKFFISKYTCEDITDQFFSRWYSYVYNGNYDITQEGDGIGYFYTPFFYCENGKSYTLANESLTCEGAQSLQIQLLYYETQYDAINANSNLTIQILNTYNTEEEDLYLENSLINFTNNTGNSKYCRIRYAITTYDGNNADLYGNTIMLFNGTYTSWNQLPKIPNIYKESSSSIVQNSNEIKQTVNKLVIGNSNLLKQTNFTDEGSINLWKSSTNLNGEIVEGINSGANAYKVHLTAGNQTFLSQRLNYYGVGNFILEANRTYTFSCYFKDLSTTGTQPNPIDNVTFGIYNGTNYSSSNNLIFAKDFLYTSGGEWQKFTATFTMPQKTLDYAYLALRVFNLNTEADWYICQPKLEIGATATDYYAQINDASTSFIQQTADMIRLQVQNTGIDITNQKITLNGNTEVNGALTISDEDTGFILQGNGGATQISPKSVGTYTDFINNSNSNVTKTSNVYGEKLPISIDNYYRYSFTNNFTVGNVGQGKTITFTPNPAIYYKESLTIVGKWTNITTSVTNQTISLKLYENGVLQTTNTNLNSFNYTSLGTGTITIQIDVTADVSKSALDTTDIIINNNVMDSITINWIIPNDAYTLLGYDGLGLNLGTSSNVYFNKDNAIFRYGNYGLKVDTDGVTKYQNNNWVALNTPLLFNYTGTNFNWGTYNYDTVITTSSSAVSITLPANPYTGRLVYIRKNGSGNVSVTANKPLRNSYSGTVSSYTIQNAYLVSFLFDGTNWLINYMT